MSRARLVAASALLAVVATLTLVAGRPSSAVAADGFTLTSSTVYRFDPAVPAVDVEATYVMTNTSPDRDLGGGRFRFFYFTGITVPFEAGATAVSVQVNGSDASYEVVEDEGFMALDVSYRSNLRYRKTATTVVRYRLLGDPPRSEDSFVRVNPAYASFPVYGFGDDGEADVRIEVPTGWEIDYVGSDLSSTRQGDTVVYEALEIASPFDFGVAFTARLDDALESTPVSAGGASFEVRSWPGDTEWRDFATLHVTDGVPALEQLVGQPWPEANETEVIEASTPYLRGYAGYYFADTDVIEVGEDLDSHTMLHELSHAWFNGSTISDRWISEGLADDVGARAVAALGGDEPSPDDYEPGDLDATIEEFPLNSWETLAAGIDDASEFYGYKTSFEVIRALRLEIGEENMTELISAIVDGERAYAREGDVASGRVVGWKEFLDLAEQVGGSESVDGLYRDLVVTDGQATTLDLRDEALTRYDELVQRGGDWLPPEAVRQPMAAWNFERADERIDATVEVLDLRDDWAEALLPAGLTPSAALEDSYETATDLDDLRSDVDEQLDVAEEFAAHHADLVADLASIGQTVPVLDQAEYDLAPSQYLGEFDGLADQADELATDVTEAEAVLAPWELAAPTLAADAFVESPDAAIETADHTVAAARDVAAAFAARERNGSVLDKIGGVGGDVDGDLDTAAAQLAAGDTEAAAATARSTQRTIESWSSRGIRRIGGAAVVLVGLVLIIGLRRRSGGRELVASTGAGADEHDLLV